MTDHRADNERFAVLMQAAQAGDADAYVQLLEDLTPRLRRIVRHRRQFLAIEDVEDLVQDILLSLHAARATYDSRRPFVPSLLAIVRNRLADGARRHARVLIHEAHVEDLDVTFFAVATNSEAETGDPHALREAIDTLPAGQRDAIEMLKLKEMSLKEAAAASGTTVDALKVATHRAMAALRKKLT